MTPERRRERRRRARLRHAKRLRALFEQIDRDAVSYNENCLSPGEEPVPEYDPESIRCLAWLDQRIAELEAQG